jgi:hypothetical protein
MSFQNNFKLRLNTNIGTLSMTDVRLILKDVYDQLENLNLQMEKINNETRTVSTDRLKAGRTFGKDVPTT